MPPRWSPETTVPSSSCGLAEEGGGLAHLPLGDELTDPARRHAFDERHVDDLEPETAEEPDVSLPPAPKAECLRCDDGFRPDRLEDPGHEFLRLEPAQRFGELDEEDVVRAGLLDQLDAPAKRRQELDVVAEHQPRMRVEGDDGRAEAGRLRRFDRRPVPAVHAVEGADRDGAFGRLELGRRAHDAHAGSSSGSSRSFGTGDGTSHRTPRTPAAAANHRVGRRPKAEPSAPPASAPRGRTP